MARETGPGRGAIARRRVATEARGEALVREVIAQVYDAAVDDSLWPLVLVELGRVVDCPGASLQMQSARTGEIVFASVGGFDPEMLDEYARHFVDIDIRLQAALAAPREQVLDISELLDPAVYRRSVVFNEFFGRHDMGRALGGIFTVDEDHYAAIGGQRSWRTQPFDSSEKERFASVVPHLGRALRIRTQLSIERRARQSLEAILDRLPQAVLVLGRDLRAVYVNQRAEEILRSADGIALRGGRLALADGRAAATLRAGLAAIAAGGADLPAPVRADRPSLAPAYELLLGRLPHALSLLVPAEAVAVLFVSSPAEALDLDETVLAGLYGLTGAEAALASALGRGGTVEEFASSRKVSMATARTQVRALLEKTGTRRQVDLVRLLATGLAALRRR